MIKVDGYVVRKAAAIAAVQESDTTGATSLTPLPENKKIFAATQWQL